MSFCSHCGASLAPDARFCSRCGKPVATVSETTAATAGAATAAGAASGAAHAATPASAPPHVTPPPHPAAAAARPVPPPPPQSGPAPAARRRPQDAGGKWWIVPLVIVGFVVILWLILAGLPFGREERETIAETDTIAEQPAPTTATPTATIVDVTPDDEIPLTQTTLPPMQTTTTVPPGTLPPTTTVAGAPPPTTTMAPPQSTMPPPMTSAPSRETAPPPAEPSPSGPGLSGADAEARLRSYLLSRNYYPDVAKSCLQIRSQGYVNEGYGFSVWQACVGGGGAKRVGMWRVDAKNGSLYRRNDSGKYVSP